MAVEAGQLNQNKRNLKIAKVLEKFLEPNFKIQNDVYLNLFLTHLIGKKGDNQPLNRESIEVYSNWLIKASNLWKKTVPPSVILSFTLNLASQLSPNEQIFVKLNGLNVYENLVAIAQANLGNDASVTLGWITLLCSFLDHKSGVQWVLVTNYWTAVVVLAREAHTLYIRNKAYQFIAGLLQKSIVLNQNFCSNLVAMLIKPLEDTLRGLPSTECVQQTFIENTSLFESLRPSLVCISEVMEIVLKSGQSEVVNIFVELKTAELAQSMLLLSQIEDFSFEIIKIRCILLFSKLRKEGPINQAGPKQIAHDSMTLFDIKTIFDLIQNEMERDHVRCVIKICHYAHTLYCSLAGRMPLCIRKGEPIEFQNQMVLFQIIPIMAFYCEKLEMTIDIFLEDVLRREFVQKLVNLSAIRTVEICFRWKDRLVQKPNLIEDMTFGLQYMLKSKKLLDKDTAAMFFQPLVYSLKDTLTLTEKSKCADLGPGFTNFLLTLIETMINLVQTFEFTWRDSIETISVMSIACRFLQYTHWEQKLVISGLKLLNLALSKYMSPEMVLLMDNPKDSLVSDTGALLYAKCHDSSWEVRDTALENIYTLSLNANGKFPSFANILLESQIPQLVVQMAFKDWEFYVRATAFRCLHELIQIEEVWDILMDNDRFLEDVLDVFGNETEGVVRKEVATLIYKITKCQGFPPRLLPRLYDVMTHATIADLHWEVKYNALDFWFYLSEQYLNNQGMIDYSFPAVTFSKENRKIVNLTETEVRKRLVKVLNQLSRIGCLYVLKCACLDDCDVEVSRKATKTTVHIINMLKKYNVPAENIDIEEDPSDASDKKADSPFESASVSSTDTPSPQVSTYLFDPLSPFPIPPSPSLNLDLLPPTPDPLHNDLAHESMVRTPKFNNIEVESVLDDILNASDMSFLQQIYSPSDQQKNISSEMKKSTYLAPSEYLKFVYHEAEKYTNEKTQWLDSLDEFDSLLDDILKEYKVVSDVNAMDCY